MQTSVVASPGWGAFAVAEEAVTRRESDYLTVAAIALAYILLLQVILTLVGPDIKALLGL